MESWNLEDQIKQILRFAHLERFPAPLSRCLSCNEILTDVPNESVRNRVPVYVFSTQTHFKLCPKCRKIFWSGTHREAALKVLDHFLTDVRQQNRTLKSGASPSKTGRTELHFEQQ